MLKEAIVLAGGFGTRLRSMVDDIPKPMALIKNIPFLAYLLQQLQKYNFEKVVLAAGYKYEVIESYFGKSFRNLRLDYSIEEEPLGTGGAIFKAISLVNADYCFVLNGDTFFNVDLNSLEEKFLRTNSGLMVALKPMVNFDRYGSVETDNVKIVSFKEKKFCKEGLINGGVYVVRKDWLEGRVTGKIFSFEKDVLEKAVYKDKISYYISDGYFIDIGIPEDYRRAARELPEIYPPTPLNGG